MTPITWPAVATVLAAVVAAVAALLGIVIKTRWDFRTAASNEKTRWRRERREGVYAEFLRAVNRYVRLLPDRPSIEPLRFVGQLGDENSFIAVVSHELGIPFDVVAVAGAPTAQEIAWQELATALSAIRTYGSVAVCQEASHLVELLSDLRAQLAAASVASDPRRDDEQMRLAVRIRRQRARVARLIREDLDLDD